MDTLEVSRQLSYVTQAIGELTEQVKVFNLTSIEETRTKELYLRALKAYGKICGMNPVDIDFATQYKNDLEKFLIDYHRGERIDLEGILELTDILTHYNHNLSWS